MNDLPRIPDEVLERQRAASDPAASAWVSANAGAGKTYVLAQRVIRLLLGGTDPGKILCLTFTKAAAANMATTVFDTLARWTALDDDALDAAIRAMSNERPGVALRARARRLFALALETPGGLKVQTIHAFCTRLLQQFPFEANVAARFAVLEETERKQLLEKLSLDVLLEAAGQPDSPLGRALATAITSAADQTFREVVNEAIAEHDALRGWIERAGGVSAAITELSQMLGVAPDVSPSRIDEEVVNSPILPMSEWAAVAELCKTGTTRDQEQGDRLIEALQAQGSARAIAYSRFFLDGKFKPRSSLLTQALNKKHPGLAERLKQEQARVAALRNLRNAVVCRDKTEALVMVAAAVIDRYEAEKGRRGRLDYDDLIDKTLAMLSTVHPTWVHYKLDLGIDHVLIDEAQDTSPKQWQVIEHLVADFASGAGARGALKRSIFAVGDDKQSIFSFQGAAPEAFADKRSNFKRTYDASGLPFHPIEFKYSFRSVQTVLDAVDKVFRQPHAFKGLSADQVPTVHTAVRSQAPGLVEIWPMVEPENSPPVEGWDAPFDTIVRDEPARGAGAQDRDERAALARPASQRRRRRQAPCGDARRYPHSGAPARTAVRGGHPRAQECRRAGRGRRPARAHRAHCGDGSHRARRCAAAARRRPGARNRAEESVVRSRRERALLARLEPQGIAARRLEREGRRQRRLRARIRATRSPSQGGEERNAVRLLCARARSRARTPAVPVATRTRSERRARRVSQPRARLRAERDAVAAGVRRHGCAPRMPRSSATWRSTATRCG